MTYAICICIFVWAVIQTHDSEIGRWICFELLYNLALQNHTLGVLCATVNVFNKYAGPKKPFLCPGGWVALSWGRVVSGGRTDCTNNIVPNRALPTPEMRLFQLGKMHKNMWFQRWFFENFSGGIATILGRATAPLPRPHPSRRFAPPAPRSGPSVPPSSRSEREYKLYLRLF